MQDTMQTSRGKPNHFHRTLAGFTFSTFDGFGLRCLLPTRPIEPASYPVSVRQVAILLHASFRQHLAAMPLRFANPSPPSGWVGTFTHKLLNMPGTQERGRSHSQTANCGPLWVHWDLVSRLPSIKHSSIWAATETACRDPRQSLR